MVYDPVGMIIPSLKVSGDLVCMTCFASAQLALLLPYRSPLLQFINWNGRIIVVGFAAGTIEKIPANLILLKQCTIMGLFWGAHIANEVSKAGELVVRRTSPSHPACTPPQPDRIPEAWNGIFDLLESKKCRPNVFEHVFDGLGTLPGALKDLQDRKTWGKVVIRVRADPLFPPKSKSKM